MDVSFTDATPLRVKDSKHQLQLFTENTPNGKRVQILVEELREEPDFDCQTQLIDLEADEQKKDWFLKINPAGRIPVLIDTPSSDGPIAVMESPAILQYIQENYDPKNLFGFNSAAERSQVSQWLFMWHNTARNHGLTRAFMNQEGADSPAAASLKQRMLPAYALIEDHLSGKHTGATREYLAGAGRGKYSIADMGAWPHVRSWRSLGFSEEEVGAKFPSMLAWVDRIEQRPAVQRGISNKLYSSEENPALVARSD